MPPDQPFSSVPSSAYELEQLRQQLLQREQQLVEMQAAHEDFLRAVSHDLRAPLRHITSYAPLIGEVLQDAGIGGNAFEEAQEFLGVIEQAARRMGRMLDGLLVLSRIARAPLQLQPVVVADVLAQVQDELTSQYAQQPVEWQSTLAAPSFKADPVLVRQLLRELLDNALKFSRGQQPARIVVATQVQPEGGVVLQVQDNGAGFNAAQSSGLFGVFQRLHRESEFEGVGVGLAIVRSIAQRHGAQTSAIAQMGQGCTVRIIWPA